MNVGQKLEIFVLAFMLPWCGARELNTLVHTNYDTFVGISAKPPFLCLIRRLNRSNPQRPLCPNFLEGFQRILNFCLFASCKCAEVVTSRFELKSGVKRTWYIYGILQGFCLYLETESQTRKNERERERERKVCMVRLDCVLKIMNDSCLRFNEMDLTLKFEDPK